MIEVYESPFSADLSSPLNRKHPWSPRSQWVSPFLQSKRMDIVSTSHLTAAMFLHAEFAIVLFYEEALAVY
jgi:hypothetical protein